MLHVCLTEGLLMEQNAGSEALTSSTSSIHETILWKSHTVALSICACQVIHAMLRVAADSPDGSAHLQLCVLGAQSA